MNQELQHLIGKLVGRRLFNVLVGPAGVHYDFAAGTDLLARIPELSILSNTRLTIYSRAKKCLFSGGPYPAYSCQEELSNLLTDREVANAEFDSQKNAARIILDDEILLSLLPCVEIKKEETCWSIHACSQELIQKNGLGFLIGAAKVERIKK
jgi:hypothetical protein